MFRVFLDTCVWFAIAEDPKRFPYLAVIEEMLRRKVIQLLVPRLAMKEFHRRRANIAHATETSLRPHVRAVREASIALGGPKKEQAAFLARLDELLAHGAIEGGGAVQALDRMERLLQESQIIEDTEEVTHAAVQRGIAKRAPNGMADAILFETYAKCVREAPSGDQFVFVTHNKRDFSYMQRNEALPHPHLADTFVDGRSHYFIDLLAALNHVEPAVTAEVLARNQPTLASLIEQFLEEVPFDSSLKSLLARYSKWDIGKKPLAKLRPGDYMDHIKFRRKSVAASTALQDFVALKIVFLWAQEHKSTDVSLEVLERARKDALAQGLVAKSKRAPVRRLSREDEQRLIEAFEARQRHHRTEIGMVDVMQFALWSARRMKEICNLRWEDFHSDSRTCGYKNEKAGRKMRFPLLGRALDIVNKQLEVTGGKGRIFPYNAKSTGQAFTQVKNQLKIKITFDDLKEEGIRRLLESEDYPFALVQQLDPKKVLDIRAQLDAGHALQK